MRFADLSVGKKLTGVFALLLTATVALGLFAQYSLSKVNDVASDMGGNILPAVKALGQFQYAITRYRSFQFNSFLQLSEQQRAVVKENQQKLLEMADAAWAKYEPAVRPGKERELAEKIATAKTAYLALNAKADDVLKSNGAEGGVAFLMGESRDAFTTLIDAINADVQYHDELSLKRSQDGVSAFDVAHLWIYIALALGAAFCIGAGLMLIRAISKPLNNMTNAMGELARGNLNAHVPNSDQQDEIGKLAEAMTSFKNQLAAAEEAKAEQTRIIVSSIGTGLDHLAKGNLTHRVTADLSGAFAKLKDDFNTAMERLQDTVTNVLNSTNQITNNASEISTAADDLSRRTEQQAASLEETAAALEEITATVKKTATNAKEASSSVVGAKEAAENGGSVVETAVKAMDAIAHSSKQITDIIGVIDEIAFQTNLLALNAGVEAARAGDAGRGFAVVASEVRALAQRSSAAAKEIKALINTSGEHVGDGVKYVAETGHALKRIVDQVVQINSLVTEMAQAAEQEATGIEQVNAAVAQMDQVTQQNAAMVEESTAASRNLAGETKVLTELIGFFSVGETSHHETRSQVKPRPSVAPTPRRSTAKPGLKVASAGNGRTTTAQSSGDNGWEEF